MQENNKNSQVWGGGAGIRKKDFIKMDAKKTRSKHIGGILTNLVGK